MSQFKNLVFEGGGVKGIAYAGALDKLEKMNILNEIVRVAGTSAGAITATLLALGANSKDIKEIIGGTQFCKFMDDSFGVIRDIKRFIEDYGWYKGDEFANWIKKQIYALTGEQNLTFSELVKLVEQSNNNNKFKRLYIIGTDLTNQLSKEYSFEKTPDEPIWKAVRVSMSIPLFFACVKSDSGNNVFIDGGVSWNYPIDIFDDKKFLIDKNAYITPKHTRYNEDHIYNKETLGFRVDTEDEIKYEKENWRMPPIKISDFIDYTKALATYMCDMANKLHLHKNDWHRTVFIDASGVKSTEFELSNEQINKLVENGIEGVAHYFEWFNNTGTKEVPINKLLK